MPGDQTWSFLRPQLRLDKIVPLTYRMDVPAEREEFFRSYTRKEHV